MRISPLFFLIITAFTSRVNAYPIKPKFLRQLVSESKFIIVGHVLNIRENEDEFAELGSKIAKILVSENLQGNVNRDTIEMGFNPNVVCPSPDKYFEGTNFIGFLEKDENGRFFAPDLKYGVKNLSTDEIRIYKSRIFEIQEISKITDKERQLEETLEWFIKCAENEVTSVEGTAELHQDSEFMSSFLAYRDQIWETVFDIEKKERLKNALFQTRNNIDFGLVFLIYKGNEKQINDFLIRKLKSMNSEFWNAHPYLSILKKNTNSIEIDDIWRTYEELCFTSNNENELREIVKKFIEVIENK
jgi:hypothetical protein